MKIATILFLLCTPCWLFAQNDLLINYLKINRQQQVSNGLSRYMTFHDHSLPNTPHHQHLYYDPFANTTETKTTYTFEAQYYINTRLLVNAKIPWIQKTRTENQLLTDAKSGLGDITLSGKYHLFNSDLYQQVQSRQHRFLIGAGTTLPVGSYNDFSENGEIEPHLQPGSGAINVRFTADYLFSMPNWSFYTKAIYQLNTANKYNYKYGDQFLISTNVSYRQAIADLLLSPNLGLQYEQHQQDFMDNAPSSEDNAAKIVAAAIGLQITYKHLSTSFTYSKPIVQQLQGLQIKRKHQWAVALYWQFKKREIVKTRIR